MTGSAKKPPTTDREAASDLDRVLGLARLGMDKAEIAGKLGMTLDRFEMYLRGERRIHGLQDVLDQAKEQEIFELERRLDKFSKGEFVVDDDGKPIAAAIQFNSTKMLLERKMPSHWGTKSEADAKEDHKDLIQKLQEGRLANAKKSAKKKPKADAEED